MQLIYQNTRSRRLRWLTFSLALFAAIFLVWAWSLSQDYGTAIGDGAKRQEAAVRFTVAAIVALLGVVPLVCMVVYNRRYVLRIERVDSEVVVTILGTIGSYSRTHRIGDFIQSQWHEGDWPIFNSVRAPWLSLSAQHMTLPYLIDAQAVGFSRQRVERLVPSDRSTRRSPPGESGSVR